MAGHSEEGEYSGLDDVGVMLGGGPEGEGEM